MKFIFEVKIKPGHTEEEYTTAWQAGGAIIQREPGAMGTRLHRKIGEPDTLLAIATWRSKADRDTAMEKLAHADVETRQLLDRHEDFGSITIIGNFDDPSWAVDPKAQ